jgi:fimbrial chaperone protein
MPRFLPFIVLGLLLVLAGESLAYRLVPITLDFTPSGRSANQTFRVENDGDEPIAVEVTMRTREMDIDGNEVRNDAEDDFMIYPPQMVIKPNQVQTVRVKWLGDPSPKTEMAYRLITEQLPIQLNRAEKGATGITMLVRYVGTVYIVPEGAEADVVLETATRETAEDGSQMAAITLWNKGRAHGIMKAPQLTLMAGGQSVNVPLTDLADIDTQNILAGGRRKFVVALPDGLGAGALSAEFSADLSR